MSNGVINRSPMSKINSSNDLKARRNIFLVFAAKEHGERLCKSLLPPGGSNTVSINKIVGILGVEGILRAMGIDPPSLAGNVDVKCHNIVKAISFAPIPDAMTLAIAKVAGAHDITSITEVLANTRRIRISC